MAVVSRPLYLRAERLEKKKKLRPGGQSYFSTELQKHVGQRTTASVVGGGETI